MKETAIMYLAYIEFLYCFGVCFFQKENDRMNIIARIMDKMEKEKSIVRYWRKKGATIGEDAEIYSTANFGSEPYLISIGITCESTTEYNWLPTMEGYGHYEDISGA
jgi:hypothetical protein